MSTIQTTATFPNIPAENLNLFKDLGELFERIIEAGGDMEVEGFGTPSEELLAMTAAMNATVYKPFQSK